MKRTLFTRQRQCQFITGDNHHYQRAKDRQSKNAEFVCGATRAVLGQESPSHMYTKKTGFFEQAWHPQTALVKAKARCQRQKVLLHEIIVRKVSCISPSQ